MLPSIKVIINTGIRFKGLFQPIKNKLGINTRNDISNPFFTPLIFNDEVEARTPITTHMLKALKLASQVKPCSNIGIKSITPTIKPRTKRQSNGNC